MVSPVCVGACPKRCIGVTGLWGRGLNVLPLPLSTVSLPPQRGSIRTVRKTDMTNGAATWKNTSCVSSQFRRRTLTSSDSGKLQMVRAPTRQHRSRYMLNTAILCVDLMWCRGGGGHRSSTQRASGDSVASSTAVSTMPSTDCP